MANEVDVARTALTIAAVKAHKLADCYGKLATELDKAPWEPRFKGRDRGAKAAFDQLRDATVTHIKANGEAAKLSIGIFHKYGVTPDESAEPQVHAIIEEVVEPAEIDPEPGEAEKKTWREKMGFTKKETESDSELQKADDDDWDADVETKVSPEGPGGRRTVSEK